MTRVLIRRRRWVRRRRRQGLNAGFLSVGDGHRRRLLQGAFHQSSVHDFHVLVDVQNLHHLPFKLWIPALHIVADLVWLTSPCVSIRCSFDRLSSSRLGWLAAKQCFRTWLC